MFNIDNPKLEELPTLARLKRSTIVAVIGAALILIAVVLPAEYGIDPTGAGQVLGLTKMGEIKLELRQEAEEDHEDEENSHSFNIFDSVLGVLVGRAIAQDTWQDTIAFTLEPGEHTETKLVMIEGAEAQYVWTATGGRINFDLHAHGGGQSKTYEKGRGATNGEGSFVAPFKGEHGWFWRNRDNSAITITLKINGDYLEIIRSE
ncbi:MAG: transmembrane anchor protein [Gammaproteobacteria bacterium]|nr:transmembrane anchor protein [Gammaproteobacteria bacterium]